MADRGFDGIQALKNDAEIRLHCLDRRVVNAVDLMMQQTLEPGSIAGIAQAIGTSERELNRLFRKHLRVAPQQYWRSLRLKVQNGCPFDLPTINAASLALPVISVEPCADAFDCPLPDIAYCRSRPHFAHAFLLSSAAAPQIIVTERISSSQVPKAGDVGSWRHLPKNAR